MEALHISSTKNNTQAAKQIPQAYKPAKILEL